MNATSHILNISGKRSTAFMGEEIAMASNRETNEATRYEWDTVRVFKIDPSWASRQERKTGRKIDPYRIGIAKCTIWEGERDRYRVFYVKTIAQVLGIIRSNVPKFYQEIDEQLRLNAPKPPTQLHESGRSPVES